MAVREMTDIPELVERLQTERARELDVLRTQEQLSMHTTSGPDGPGVALLVGAVGVVGIMNQAHQQLAGKLDIPWRYYQRMIQHDTMLLCENVNRWLRHDDKALKTRRLVRMVNSKVRAFLSDRYRPISHLDLVTTAVQVITGQDAEGRDKPWARGAKCFSWALNPMKLDVEFVNPGIGVNFNADELTVAPDLDPNLDDGLKGWFDRANQQGGHWVFPTARIRNSETGHGGLYVDVGILEGVCLNGLHFTRNLAQIHVGGKLQEDQLWSPDTLHKMNQVIFAKVQDTVRAAFDPEQFLVHCKRFKGLEAEVVNAREAVDTLVELNGLTEEIRGEILACYASTTQRRDNLFDVTRAVTAAAHAVRPEHPEQASQLEDLGGQLVQQGRKALVKA